MLCGAICSTQIAQTIEQKNGPPLGGPICLVLSVLGELVASALFAIDGSGCVSRIESWVLLYDTVQLLNTAGKSVTSR